MKDYNILILSAGRRVELIQLFQKAAQKLAIKSTILAGDCSKTAPALYFADRKVILPRINEANYIESIITVCQREKIKLIIPTIDTDLSLLSQEKERIELRCDAQVLISSPHVISICGDKIKTQDFFEDHGFMIPQMYTKEELDSTDLHFPLFIKPKAGSSSINAFIVNNLPELSTYRNLVKESIVQDFVEGQEFTIDAFIDFKGNLITVAPRLRMATRSGEISKGKIIKDHAIIASIRKLVALLKPIGPITVQLIKTDKGLEYIEVNPRFGGGAPMSIESGADSCENIYRLLMGETLKYNENYRDNLTFMRFDKSICLDETMELI